jgi:putative transposase
MLLRNDVLEYGGERPRRLRVLWVGGESGLVYTYELERGASFPCAAALDTLTVHIREGHARLVPFAPEVPTVNAQALPPKHLALRDSAWAIIGPLVREEPAIFETRSRGRMIAACCVAHGVSHPTVYRYLRRYWERGQHPDALLPDYANSGAPGRTRRANADIKRGRPSQSGTAGANADPALRATMRAAVLRYVAIHSVFSQRDAYRQMIADFFADSDRTAPSYGQFRYWLMRDGGIPPSP